MVLDGRVLPVSPMLNLQSGIEIHQEAAYACVAGEARAFSIACPRLQDLNSTAMALAIIESLLCFARVYFRAVLGRWCMFVRK